LDIIRKLNRELFNPLIIMPFTGPLIKDFEKAGARVIIANTGYIRRYVNPFKLGYNLLRILFSIPGIMRIIKNNHINLVHSNSSIVFGGAIAAKLCKVNHVWHVREVKQKPSFIMHIIKLLIVSLSAKIVAISDAVRINLCDISAADSKIVKINDGVDLEVFYPKQKSPKLMSEFRIHKAGNIVGAIGLIMPLKGYEYFLEAASIVKKALPDTVFMVVGDTVISRHNSYKQSLKNKAASLGIADNVVFTGMRQDVPDIISLMDITVLASIVPEGMGRVIIESMAMSKPVITTNLGGQSEIIEHNKDGILIPPKDSFALARAIISLLKDNNKLLSLAESGFKKVQDNFDLNKKIKELEELFLSLC
jgi:predicted outer membrane repeat protein